jgi:hypothetical protein
MFLPANHVGTTLAQNIDKASLTDQVKRTYHNQALPVSVPQVDNLLRPCRVTIRYEAAVKLGIV